MRAQALFTTLLAIGVTVASGADLSFLAPDSPFGASGSHEASGARPPRFELRGIMAAPDGMRFCIYDTERKAGVWVAVGEEGNPFVITSAGADLNQVTMERDGRLFILKLRESKVTAAPPFASVVETTAQPEVVVHSERGRQPGDVRAPIPGNPQ
jgi:hypothetical protein